MWGTKSKLLFCQTQVELLKHFRHGDLTWSRQSILDPDCITPVLNVETGAQFFNLKTRRCTVQRLNKSITPISCLSLTTSFAFGNHSVKAPSMIYSCSSYLSECPKQWQVARGERGQTQNGRDATIMRPTCIIKSCWHTWRRKKGRQRDIFSN